MLEPNECDALARQIDEWGGVSKAELLELSGVPETQYAELVQLLLEHYKHFQVGPRKSGGITLKLRQAAAPEDEQNPGPLPKGTPWEQQALAVLRPVLKHSDAENLLGRMKDVLRCWRKDQTGKNRRGSKDELISALLAAYDIDLLEDKERRLTIAKAFGQAKVCPDRWIAGSASALRFVNALGLPEELAGIRVKNRQVDIERLESGIVFPRLLGFQEEVKAKSLHLLRNGGRRAIISMPTGAGKTRVAVEILAEYCRGLSKRNYTLIWLAHNQELCEQAAQCLIEVWKATPSLPDMDMVRFWGNYCQSSSRADLQSVLESATPQILVSTPQRIANVLMERRGLDDAFLRETILDAELIVVDEAHRGAAPTYKQILASILDTQHNCAVLGLTATPFRMEYVQNDPMAGTQELKDIFEELIDPCDSLSRPFHVALQAQGVLAVPHHRKIMTDCAIRLSPHEADMGEEALDRLLGVKADSNRRRAVILPEITQVFASQPDAKMIYFGPSVPDAMAMGFLLRQVGLRTQVVTGETTTGARLRAIEAFRHGDTQVLCNCEVLTTGFDAPQITHVVMARPTVSQVLYEQMIGRGLRGPKFGGTAQVEILDCVDTYAGISPRLGYLDHLEVWGRG